MSLCVNIVHTGYEQYTWLYGQTEKRKMIDKTETQNGHSNQVFRNLI